MRTQTKNGFTYHDYRDNMIGWGWNILSMTRTGEFSADIMGVGKGIKKDHIIVISQNNEYGNIALQVEDVGYDSNPPDLYNAKVKSIGYVE